MASADGEEPGPLLRAGGTQAQQPHAPSWRRRLGRKPHRTNTRWCAGITPALPGDNSRFRRRWLAARENGHSALAGTNTAGDSEEYAGLNGGRVPPDDPALIERVRDLFHDHWLGRDNRVVHRILECDTAVTVTPLAEAPKHPQRQPPPFANGIHHLFRDGLQHARDDRPRDRDESANLVRDRIALPALPYFHGGSVSLLHDGRKLQSRLVMVPRAE
jgi:hypothetical protein